MSSSGNNKKLATGSKTFSINLWRKNKVAVNSAKCVGKLAKNVVVGDKKFKQVKPGAGHENHVVITILCSYPMSSQRFILAIIIPESVRKETRFDKGGRVGVTRSADPGYSSFVISEECCVQCDECKDDGGFDEGLADTYEKPTTSNKAYLMRRLFNLKMFEGQKDAMVIAQGLKSNTPHAKLRRKRVKFELESLRDMVLDERAQHCQEDLSGDVPICSRGCFGRLGVEDKGQIEPCNLIVAVLGELSPFVALLHGAFSPGPVQTRPHHAERRERRRRSRYGRNLTEPANIPTDTFSDTESLQFLVVHGSDFSGVTFLLCKRELDFDIVGLSFRIHGSVNVHRDGPLNRLLPKLRSATVLSSILIGQNNVYGSLLPVSFDSTQIQFGLWLLSTKTSSLLKICFSRTYNWESATQAGTEATID
ncbi:hypothetical protein AKJ16_DCAP26638 [Drosera capensis]